MNTYIKKYLSERRSKIMTEYKELKNTNLIMRKIFADLKNDDIVGEACGDELIDKFAELRIYGTLTNPLFDASQFGLIVGLSDQRVSYVNYYENWECLIRCPIIHRGNQIHYKNLLTCLGAHRAIFQSKDPLIKKFRKVIMTILGNLCKYGEIAPNQMISDIKLKIACLADRLQKADQKIEEYEIRLQNAEIQLREANQELRIVTLNYLMPKLELF